MAAASEPPPTATVPFGGGQRRGQPIEVALVDDALAARTACLEGRDGLADLADQLVADRGIGQHVVRRDADLAGVEQLGQRDALGCDVDVGVGRHDHGALAAQLQGHRGQVLRCALVDLAADLGAAGEAQLVEALRDEFLADRAVALDHRDRVVVQVPRHQVGHHRRRRRGHLGRLEHDGVSCRDRADGGSERQREREVPRADDEHRAERLVLDPGAARQLRLLQQPVLALGPLADVLGRVVRLRPRCWRCRPTTPRTACGRDPARARRRWRARCRRPSARRLPAAACATRRPGCAPMAKVLRRPATTAGMSTAVVGELGGADASVVMGVLPDPRNTRS